METARKRDFDLSVLKAAEDTLLWLIMVIIARSYYDLHYAARFPQRIRRMGYESCRFGVIIFVLEEVSRLALKRRRMERFSRVK